MQKTKTLSRTLAVIALVVFALYVLIGGIVEDLFLVPFSLLDLTVVALVLGVSFLFTESKLLLRIGNGLLIFVALSFLEPIFYGETVSLIFAIIILVLLLVSVLGYFVSNVLLYFGYAKADAYLYENKLARSLHRIKTLVEKQVIAQNEYAQLKAMFLDPELTAPVKEDLYQKVLLLEKGLIEVSDILP